MKESVSLLMAPANIRAVALKQLNSYLLNGLLGIAVGNLTGYLIVVEQRMLLPSTL